MKARKDSSASRAGIGGEEILYLGWEVGEADGGNEFARQALVLIRAATDHHLVAFFAAHLHAHQAEVANVVLGAGVGAAGDVKVDRLENVEALSSILASATA